MEVKNADGSSSETPRTDAIAKNVCDACDETGWASAVPANFARTLERENVVLRDALQSLMTPDANAHIQRTKEELFRSAPEIEAKCRTALTERSKPEGE